MTFPSQKGSLPLFQTSASLFICWRTCASLVLCRSLQDPGACMTGPKDFPPQCAGPPKSVGEAWPNSISASYILGGEKEGLPLKLK